jgi:hypothetical protein
VYAAREAAEREVLSHVRGRGQRIPRMACGIRGEATEEEPDMNGSARSTDRIHSLLKGTRFGC